MLNVKLSHLTVATCLLVAVTSANAADIIHDSEYNTLAKQNGKKWAKEDIGIDQKLAELRKKHGKAPNIMSPQHNKTPSSPSAKS